MDYEAEVAKHGSIARAAAALQMSPSTFRDRMRGGRAGLRETRKAKASSSKSAPRVKARSLEAFREQFDRSTIVPGKIRAALEALGEEWLFEVEFAQAAGVSLTELGHYRDEFAAHQLVARAPGRGERRVWVGSIKAANAMRAML